VAQSVWARPARRTCVLRRRGGISWIDFWRGESRVRQSLGTRDADKAQAVAELLVRAEAALPAEPSPPKKAASAKPRGDAIAVPVAAAARTSGPSSGAVRPPSGRRRTTPQRGWLPEGPDPEEKSVRIRDVFRAWLAFQKSRRKARSVHAYTIACRRFGRAWGALRPAELTRQAVEEMQEAMLAAGLAPRTINHQMGLAISALRWGSDREMFDSPLPKWKRLEVKNRSPRKYLSAAELRRVFATLDAQPRFARLRPVIMLAARAGLRIGEIVWLQWADVDLENGWIQIRPKRGWSPKTAASDRSIPIASDLAKFLRSWKVCETWVAPRLRRTQWERRNLGVNVRRLFQAAGVEQDGPHQLHRLRGTFATEVLRTSGDLRSLQAMLGHGSISVTGLYLAEVDEHKRAAVSRLRLG
jgi:integrase